MKRTFLVLCLTGVLFSLQSYQKEKSKSVYVKFLSCDTIQLDGLISYPVEPANNKLIIEVSPCLVNSFMPNRRSFKQSTNDKIQDSLLKNGYTYFNFLGRKDSIQIYDRKYPVSTMHTKAQDLEAAISYIKTREDLRNKEIILYGVSEGGATSAIVASKNPEIKALVLISAPGVEGKEFIKYQSQNQDSLFIRTFGTHPEILEGLNNLSSLDTPIEKLDFESLARFRKENYERLEEIAYTNKNSDTVAFYVISKLKQKWDRENQKTKDFYKTFEKYCQSHHHFATIQPEQIALKTWEPKLYFNKIPCPVFCVYGSLDKNVEYSSSLANIKKLLSENKNEKFSYLILHGYNHSLSPVTNSYFSDLDSSIYKIIEWINKI